MGRTIRKLIEHVLPNVIRPLHALWNQMVGFLFLVLAAWAIPSAVRSLREYSGSTEGLVRIMIPVSFALLMIYFGITSFLRARRISR